MLKKLLSKGGYRALAALILCGSVSLQAAASAPVASITLPIKISLETLRQQIEADEGLSYVSLDRPERTCIKEKWISISCKITGHARRVGELELSGAGDQIRLQLPIHVSMTAKSTSRIKGQTTVKGDVVIDLRARVGLQEDWQATLDLEVAYRWQKPPTLRLLRVIKIPLKGYVNPLLDKEVAKLQAKAPRLAQELEVRSDAQRAWLDLQRTHSVSGDTPLFFRFNPSAAFFSGFEVSEGFLHAAVTVQGSPVLSTSEPKPRQSTPLPVLQKASAEHTGVEFGTDIQLAYSDVLQKLGDFEKSYELKSGANLAITEIGLGGDAGRLSLRLGASFDNRPRWLKFVDVFDWFVHEGVFSLQTTPRLDSTADTLQLVDSSVQLLEGDLETSLFESFVVEKLERRLQEHLAYQYGDSIAAMKQRLNRQLGEVGQVGDFMLTGRVHDIAFDGLRVEQDSLSVQLRLAGELELSR